MLVTQFTVPYTMNSGMADVLDLLEVFIGALGFNLKCILTCQLGTICG